MNSLQTLRRIPRRVAQPWLTILLLSFLAVSGLRNSGATHAVPMSPAQQPAERNVSEELRDAALLLQSGKPEDAERILRQVLATASQNSDAHNLLGITLDQQGKVAEAEREYRAAIRFRPNNVSAIANLGVLLAHANRSAEAIKTFESVLRIVPDHPQATLNLGLQSAAAGDDQRAIPLLEKAISLGLDSYEVRYHLALSLYNVKRFADAKRNFDAALVANPNVAGPHFYLGLIAWAAGQDEAAAESWERAVTLQPVFPEANFMLGEALRKHQRTAAAVEFYRRALDQEPGRYVYYARLGGAYILLGQPDQALEVFSAGLKRFPDLAEAHYFVALAARAQVNYDLADNELRKSLALEANNINALAQLGFVLLERNQLKEAEGLLRRALQISDRHFYANYDLGRLLFKSQRYAEALTILQHAVTLKSADAGVHYQLFMTLSRLKRTAEAERELAIFKELEAKRKARTPAAGTGELEDAPVLARPAQP